MPSSLPDLSRRQMISLVGSVGLGCLLPWRGGRPARAASAAPLFVSFEAPGAYDVTLFCDPKGKTAANAARPPNTYAAGNIQTFHGLPIAPQVPAVVQFFAAWGDKALIINGVDTSTIDHATGTRSSVSGNPDTGAPVTGALVAAVLAPDLPAAFMSNGGYTNTDNIVANTGLGGGIVRCLQTPPSGGDVHRADNWGATFKAMQARNARLAAGAVGTLRARRLALFDQAFSSTEMLSQVVATVEDLAREENVPRASPAGGGLTMGDAGMAQAMQVAAASFAHGQSQAAQFAIGVFDTHSDNDAGQTDNLTQLFAGMDYFFRLARRAGVLDRLVVHLGSDFSRTPYYNDSAAGKDHWPTTSVVFLSPGATPLLPVGRVIGATDASLTPVSLDPATLAPAGAGGVTVQPGHVHDAIRRLMGIDQSDLCQHYTLRMSQQLPLLG